MKKTIAISCYAFLFSFFCVRFVCLGSLTETPLGTLQWILGPRVECTNTFLFSLPIGVNIQMRKTTNTIILPQRTKEIKNVYCQNHLASYASIYELANVLVG